MLQITLSHIHSAVHCLWNTYEKKIRHGNSNETNCWALLSWWFCECSEAGTSSLPTVFHLFSCLFICPFLAFRLYPDLRQVDPSELSFLRLFLWWHIVKVRLCRRLFQWAFSLLHLEVGLASPWMSEFWVSLRNVVVSWDDQWHSF